MRNTKIVDYEKVVNAIWKNVEKNKVEIQLPPLKKRKGVKLVEQAVLLLSDIHFGKVNSFWDYTTNQQIITYDIPIFIKELNRLLDGIVTIRNLLLGGYDFEMLNIFCLGDLIDNEIIYRGQQKFIEEGVISQVLSLIEYLKEMVLYLLNIFPKIRMIFISGNHSRLNSKIEADYDYNNFDYLIGSILKEHTFNGIQSVEIIVPESWFYVAEIYSWKYLLHHGNSVYTWMGIPYYGILRQSKSRRMEIPYDIEIMGHFHQVMEMVTSSHSRTIINGSWIKNDNFAWRKFGILSVPQQLFFGVSPKRPKTWEFPLDLDHHLDYNNII